MSAVLDSSGKTLLDSEGGVSSEFFAPVDPGKLGSLGREKLPFRSWNSRSKNSEPIFSTLHYLPEFRLNVLFQRVFVAEQREVGRQIRDLAFASWVLLLIALFVSFLVASRFSGRIRLLVDAVVAIARGDFSTSVPARTRDELGLLARAVNKMSHDIRELMRVREQAARQELELRTAETIQRSFFPKHRIADGRLRTSTYFRPASECAGDWWGHFDLGDGRQLVVIADAVGHGASSALLAAVAFSFFATLEQNPTMARELGYSPARMLQQLNRVLWNSGGSSMTITMAAMLFDFNSRSVRYASGGHVPVVRVSMWQNPKSSELELKAKSIPVSGNIVGFSETFEIVETSFPLVSGDWFILYTDGLFENQNGGGLSLSKRRFREFLEREAPLSVNGFLQATFDHVSGFFGQSELDDDVTMVVLEVSESFAGDTA
jgi:sigma-B regulation protein RsbU (phosphoserine phosphatase)